MYFTARRKIKETNIRKIACMGNRSLGATMSVKLLNQPKWKEKQKVVVKRLGEAC